MSKTLKSAVEKASSLLAERDRIKNALSTAEAGLRSAERETQEAVSALNQTEADSILSSSPSEAKASRKGVTAARENTEALQAQVEGLRAKLAQNQTELVQVRCALRAAREEHAAAVTTEHRANVLRAAENLRVVMQRALAADAGISNGSHSVAAWLQLAVFPDPSNFGKNLLSIANHGSRGVVAPWNDNAELSALAIPEHLVLSRRLDQELAATDESAAPTASSLKKGK